MMSILYDKSLDLTKILAVTALSTQNEGKSVYFLFGSYVTLLLFATFIYILSLVNDADLSENIC